MRRLVILVLLMTSSVSLGQSAPATPDGSDVAHLESLLRDGASSGEVFYNLGIAQFHEGRIGESMASMLAARRDMPRDPEVAANLKVITSRISDKLEPTVSRSVWGLLAFWVFDFVPRELLWAGSLFWTAGFAALIARRRLVKGDGVLRASALLCLVAGTILLISVPGGMAVQKPWGAVISSSVAVKASPDGKVDVFVLHEGAPFELRDSRNGWYSIALSDGKSGWVPTSDVKVYGL